MNNTLSQEAVKQREPEICFETQQLFKAIADISARLDKLTNKLASVLRNEPESTSPPKAGEITPTKTPLGNEIRVAREKIEHLTDTMGRLTELIEL